MTDAFHFYYLRPLIKRYYDADLYLVSYYFGGDFVIYFRSWLRCHNFENKTILPCSGSID